MSRRTTPEDVRGIVDSDSTIDINPFLDVATALTDYVSDRDVDSLLSDALLIQIEKYLAAHFYAIRDPQYQSKKTELASATFQGKTELGLDLTHWGQTAKVLDVTGMLIELSQGARRPQMAWLGKPTSDQISYEDRD